MVREVVTILHPWELPASELGGEGYRTIKAAMHEVFGGLIHVTKLCKTWACKLSIVGLEQFSHAALGYETESSMGGKTVEEVVTEFIKTLSSRTPQTSRSSRTTHSLYFLRLEKYREDLGEHDFEIETQELLSVPPSLRPWRPLQ